MWVATCLVIFTFKLRIIFLDLATGCTCYLSAVLRNQILDAKLALHMCWLTRLLTLYGTTSASVTSRLKTINSNTCFSEIFIKPNLLFFSDAFRDIILSLDLCSLMSVPGLNNESQDEDTASDPNLTFIWQMYSRNLEGMQKVTWQAKRSMVIHEFWGTSLPMVAKVSCS